MCGICGTLNFDASPADEAALRRMNGLMAHRGPDGEGVHIDGPLGLGHRRLAIIDPALGAQPLLNDDASIALSFNGEIYNYVELRKELERDFRFRTNCDTEVLLRAYEKWGVACVERFRGMFAFAIWDSRSQTLHLVRDRVGIKPLFYYAGPKRFAFASELSPLLSLGFAGRAVKPESVGRFLAYQYVGAPDTIYADVMKLEPGCRLEVGAASGQVRKFRHWELNPEPRERDEKEALEELDALLDEIVRIYVRSDVPFGAFLSGGVDSSLVTAEMARILKEPVSSFTIGFKEDAHSEAPHAARAAGIIGTRHFEKIVTPELAEELLAKMAVHFGEPFGDSSAIPTFYVSKETSTHVKMALSGDGGDELFGGYLSYAGAFKEYCMSQTPGRPASRLAASLACRLLGRFAPRRLHARSGLPPQAFHDMHRQAFLSSGELEEAMASGSSLPALGGFDWRFSKSADLICKFQAQDFKTYLHDDVLTKVDRMSMANSLEVRVPLLDHKLVEFAFTLPLSLRLRPSPSLPSGIDSKYLLKRSAARFYPQDFLDRKKQGFGIPVIEWCSGPLRPLIERELRRKSNPVYEWVRFDYASSLLDEFFGSGRGCVKLWYLLCLSLWGRHVEGWR